MKWRTNWNSSEFPDFSEVNHQPSMTIPDQSMSVSELIQRHRRGLTFPDAKVPIYHMDEKGEALDLPDLSTLDMAELQILREEAAANVQHIKDELNRQEQRLQKERLDKLKQQRAEQLEQARRDGAQQGPYKTQQPRNYSRGDQSGVSHPDALEGFIPDSGG